MASLNKKVLIITYYWPPSGGSGVQRWLKFVKYLPQFGYEPHVFTPENPSFTLTDESLLRDVPDEAEVIRFPIWEPYDLFFGLLKFTGGKKHTKATDFVATKKTSLLQRVASWVRGNFFIPDPRVFWVRPSVRFLSEYLEQNDIKTIITTGPPHSIHLIGLRLKRKNRSIKWLADFRDPWSEWGLLDSLHAGALARRRHRKFEQQVLKHADEVLTITPFFVRRFEALGNRQVHLFTNGFDEDDFRNMIRPRTGKFIIRHIGIVNEKCNPVPFLSALEDLTKKDPTFAAKVQLEFIGEVHRQVRDFVSQSPVLNKIIVFRASVPHKQLLKEYGTSALLLLVLTGYKNAEGYLPGKLFEYVATGIPVLGVGPVDGDAAVLLKETRAGEMIGSQDHEGMVKALANTFQNWVEGNTPGRTSEASLDYSRRVITGKLVSLLG